VDVGLELKEVQVTPVVLKRVVDRLVFRPTMRTRESCPRGEGAVEINPAQFGIAGHVNDLPRSRKAERNGKQRQRGHDENLRRLAWRLASQFHRFGPSLQAKRRAQSKLGAGYPTRWENGATHTKRKRAS